MNKGYSARHIGLLFEERGVVLADNSVSESVNAPPAVLYKLPS